MLDNKILMNPKAARLSSIGLRGATHESIVSEVVCWKPESGSAGKQNFQNRLSSGQGFLGQSEVEFSGVTVKR